MGNRFGGLLALHRHRLGLSVEEMAKRMDWGVLAGPQIVNRVEAGTMGEPSRDEVARVCSCLALSRADECALYVAAGLLPPGNWACIDDWIIRCVPKEGDDANGSV